ncbi:CYTH-like domain-containing protein [Lipomyces orientalis]|uniref:CYTH-like domain-containing protein n=1 Tax=Lipomyces orientalis TaxID=1233043 RepID=A0ACC3TTL9_9ASCO
MDLRSIINADSANSLSSPSATPLAPPPPPPPPHPPRRTSSIADLLDPPDTPPQIASPTITSTSSLATGTPTQQMLRAALSPMVSPTLVTRSLQVQTSSPTTASAQPPPPFLSARSRSMSITSITAAEDVPSRRGSVSSTGTTANGNRSSEIKDESPALSTMNSPEVTNREIKNRDSPAPSRVKPKQEAVTQPKKSKNKPRRYNSPPIYARKWTPDWRSVYNIVGNGVNNGIKEFANGPLPKAPSPESTARVFPREDGVHDDDGSATRRERYGTFTKVEPYEDLTRRVSSWIYANVADMAPDVQNQLEIEAKIGSILSKQTRQRLSLPVDTETLLNTEMLAGTIEFESDVGSVQHQAYNVFLNACMQKSEKWKTPITYSHTKQKDIFYSMPQPPGSFNSPNRRGERLRVSIDLKTEKVIQKIVKTRVRDLMIYCPGSKYDIRISLNIERPETVEPSPQDKLSNERVKDRVSYIHQNSQIDLTQVTAPDRKTHELEVELGMKDTLQHIARIKSGILDDDYEEGIRRFLDNVRILVRRGGVELKIE